MHYFFVYVNIGALVWNFKQKVVDLITWEWNSYNDTIKNIKEVKLQEFQFKVNNHNLVTKSFLHKINKVDNARCAFCGLETETIIHVLLTVIT